MDRVACMRFWFNGGSLDSSAFIFCTIDRGSQGTSGDYNVQAWVVGKDSERSSIDTKPAMHFAFSSLLHAKMMRFLFATARTDAFMIRIQDPAPAPSNALPDLHMIQVVGCPREGRIVQNPAPLPRPPALLRWCWCGRCGLET